MFELAFDVDYHEEFHFTSWFQFGIDLIMIFLLSEMIVGMDPYQSFVDHLIVEFVLQLLLNLKVILINFL